MGSLASAQKRAIVAHHTPLVRVTDELISASSLIVPKLLGDRTGAFDLPDHPTARAMRRVAISGLQRSIGNRTVQHVNLSRTGPSALRRCGSTPCAYADEERATRVASVQRDWWDDEETPAAEEAGTSVGEWFEEQAGVAADDATEQSGGATGWVEEQAGEAEAWAGDQAAAGADWFVENGGAAAGTGDPGSLWTEGGAGAGDPGSAWTDESEAEDPSQLVSPEDYAIIQGAIQNALTIHGPWAGQGILIAAAIAAASVSIPVAIVIAVALAIIAILVSAPSSGPPPVAELGQAAVAQAALTEALALAAGITAAVTLEQVEKFKQKAADIATGIQIVIDANKALAQRCFKEIARFGNAIARVQALLAKPLDQITRDEIIAKFNDVGATKDALMACLSGGPSGGGEPLPKAA
jgi:hypothetical protein